MVYKYTITNKQPPLTSTLKVCIERERERERKREREREIPTNRTGVVMVRVCDWGEVDRGETKDYEISICCFSTKHAALRCESKDWLAGA